MAQPERSNLKSKIKARQRSVFANYSSPIGPGPSVGEVTAEAPQSFRPAVAPSTDRLPSAVDLAIARSFLYRFLAKAYEYPDPDGWAWLGQTDVQAAFRSAILVLSDSRDPLARTGFAFLEHLTGDHFESFSSEYVAAFSHAARGSCPLNEIEYGDLKADPLFQPHRLADLTAFYQAFGLEIAADAGERQDHICLELEFMSVLAAKEAFALEHQLGAEEFAVCHLTQKDFLREHLGRWTPAFARRLAHAVCQGALRALAEFTREFVAADCRAFGITAGSEELLLRPMDEAGEGLCTSCGIKNLPPGATAVT